MDENGFGTLDSFNVKMLVRLVQLTDAYLVISSDWRRFYSYEDLCRRLRDRGVPDRFLGTTPFLEDEGEDWGLVPRGLEIDAWLNTNNWTGFFLILDDRSDMEPHLDRLIQIDHEYGLVETDVEKALLALRNRDRLDD